MSSHSHDESVNDDQRGEDDSILARWAAELADRLSSGEDPNLDEFTKERPDLADQLRRLLARDRVDGQVANVRGASPDPGIRL